MRLSELKPQWGSIQKNFTPETGGEPSGNFWLRFGCPTCGLPHSVTINVGPEVADIGQMEYAAGSRCWKAEPMPDGVDWHDHLTITPSINNTGVGHGPRHPTCAFHGHIINGEIHLS